MAAALDDTALATLSLLEARILRIEHLLYGQTAAPSLAQDDSATFKMAQLERRFSALTSHIRVYGELLKIYKQHPDFFHSLAPAEPPSQLSPDAILSTVIASQSLYTTTHSALMAIKDSPIPDPSDSADLINLSERMKAIETTQTAQAADIMEMRGRSEAVIRAWYEKSIMQRSQFMADIEGRVGNVERHVRKAEHEMEAANTL